MLATEITGLIFYESHLNFHTIDDDQQGDDNVKGVPHRGPPAS